MPLIDLTHTFKENMPVYPGDRQPQILQTAQLSQDGYNDFQIKTGMHVGTHIDAPLHMIENGAKISEIEAGHFLGRGVMVDARGQAVIEADLLSNIDLRQDDIVLVLTGFDQKYAGPEYFQNFPEISQAFAQKLIEKKIKIIGTDTPSPDRPPFDVHKLLLNNNILIIENLTKLEQLLGLGEFEVMALPAKFELEAAPVRVVARTP